MSVCNLFGMCCFRANWMRFHCTGECIATIGLIGHNWYDVIIECHIVQWMDTMIRCSAIYRVIARLRS